MKRFTLKRELLLLVSGAVIFTACQKDVNHQGAESNLEEQQAPKLSGVILEEEELGINSPLLVSTKFNSSTLFAAPSGSKGGGKKVSDSDGDGIPDSSDGCPTQKETINGFQDTDGCPDTAPAPTPTPTDSDGDGIVDTSDACPTQKETFNGFEDSDGCPDTAPTTTQPGTIPASFQLVVPPVAHQGSEGTCVAFSVAYYARSIEAYYRSGASSYSNSTNIFSPEFLFNQVTPYSNCSGSGLYSSLEFLKTNGVATWQTMPYSSFNGCSLMPTQEQNLEAAKHKIPSYSRMVNADQAAIKQMIASKHPVITTVTIDPAFYSATAGYIWKSSNGNSGSHSLVLCGYDDAKKAYKAVNSWGSTWGDNGFIWIDYNFFPTVASYYVYAMSY